MKLFMIYTDKRRFEWKKNFLHSRLTAKSTCKLQNSPWKSLYFIWVVIYTSEVTVQIDGFNLKEICTRSAKDWSILLGESICPKQMQLVKVHTSSSPKPIKIYVWTVGTNAHSYSNCTCVPILQVVDDTRTTQLMCPEDYISAWTPSTASIAC